MHSERDVDLHLQREHKQRSPLYETSLILEWINEIPDMQLRDSASHIYRGITSLNINKNVSKKRFKYLEAFRPVLEHISQTLTDQLATVSSPLTTSSRAIALVITEFNAELADGYKLVILEKLDSLTNIKSSDFVVPIHRACRYLYEQLLTSYRFYFPVPPTIWKDLHQLYYLAENLQIHEVKVTSEIIVPCPSCSIADIYKQASLLALAHPYRFTRLDIETLNIAIKQWFSHCDILHATDNPQRPGLFLSVLNSDRAPHPLPLIKDRVVAQWRLIDTQNILIGLKKYLAANTDNKEINISLYSELFNSWSYLKERIAPRQEISIQVLAALGVNDSHVVLSKIVADANVKNLSGQISKLQKSASTSKMRTCTLVDQSESGACLIWEINGAEDVRIGEILTLHKLNEDARPLVGVIRWIKNVSDNSLMLGLQFLANNAEAVITKATDESHNRIQILPALILKTLGGSEATFSLITTMAEYQNGSEITIYHRANEYKLQLIEVVEATSQFTQFIFQTISASDSSTHSPYPLTRHKHDAVA